MGAESTGRHRRGCSTGIKRHARTKKIGIVETTTINTVADQRRGFITSTSVMIHFALGGGGITKKSIESEEEEPMLENVTLGNLKIELLSGIIDHG